MTTASDPPGEPGALARLDHELRTPLAAIMGYADAMRERAFGPLDDAYVGAAGSIHAAAGHMLALVERLTRQISHLTIERFDAREPVIEAMRCVDRRTAEVTLDAPRALHIDADALALRQIAINLIANAVAAGAGRIVLSLEPSGGDLVLKVDDDGPGVAKIVEGTGIGVVRALVAAHGGTFSLEGRPEGGARAQASLPVLARD